MGRGKLDSKETDANEGEKTASNTMGDGERFKQKNKEEKTCPFYKGGERSSKTKSKSEARRERDVENRPRRRERKEEGKRCGLLR